MKYLQFSFKGTYSALIFNGNYSVEDFRVYITLKYFIFSFQKLNSDCFSHCKSKYLFLSIVTDTILFIQLRKM